MVTYDQQEKVVSSPVIFVVFYIFSHQKPFQDPI